MRPTYEIPGVFWDEMPVGNVCIEAAPECGFHQFAGEPRGLFDIDSFKRIVLLSDLLKAPSKEAADAMMESVAGCDEVVLAVDYRPQSAGTIPRRFYDIRLGQIAGFVRKSLPNASVAIVDWEAAA